MHQVSAQLKRLRLSGVVETLEARERQAIEELAFLGDAAGAVDGAEGGQKSAGFVERRRRRRVEKNQLCRIGDAPLREFEHQRGQIGGEDFRRRIRFERRGLRCVP